MDNLYFQQGHTSDLAPNHADMVSRPNDESMGLTFNRCYELLHVQTGIYWPEDH